MAFQLLMAALAKAVREENDPVDPHVAQEGLPQEALPQPNAADGCKKRKVCIHICF
jgi:hypothetical protein